MTMEKRTIDFSCKHDILIQNRDGSYSRMDEPYYEAEQIAPDTWKILSSGDHSYLVAGDDEAVSIDTGYGAGNLREYLQTLTDKPVRNVFNTHSHFDHTANNGYFEKAYMAPEAIPLATIPYRSFEGIDFIQDYERVPVDDGFVYDLGNRTLEVFKIPDHTRDGIALLDRKQRLLFSGDEFMGPVKNLDSVGISTFFGYLVKLKAHRHEFDRLCAGGQIHDAALIDRYYECAQFILDGHCGEKLEGGMPRGLQRSDIHGPNGETVYDRILPHPGDGGFGKEGIFVVRNVYAVEHAGVKIIYDADKA